jgi:hypothetical protein
MATAPVRIIWWQVGAVSLATLVTCFRTFNSYNYYEIDKASEGGAV